MASIEHLIQISGTDYGKVTAPPSSVGSTVRGTTYDPETVPDLDSKTIYLTVAAKSNGFFTGWSGDVSKATISGMTCTILGSETTKVTVTANFVERVQLTYSKNDGSGETRNVSFPKSVRWALPANTFTREGYTFAGWRIDNATTGTEYADGASVLVGKAHKFFAQWTAIPGYALTTSAKCGETPVEAQVTIQPSENAAGGGWTEGTQMTASVPAAIEDGFGNVQYVFARWTASQNVTLPSDVTTASISFSMPASDASLTANYELKPLTVLHEVDAASEDKVSTSLSPSGAFKYGDTATFTASNVSPGYEFAGWYAEDGARVSDSLECNVVLRGDLTLYAKVKATITVAWGVMVNSQMVPDTNSHGTIYLGNEFAPKSVTGTFVLGSEVEVGYALPEGDEGGFGGWYEGNNRANLESLGGGRFRYVVMAPVSLYATYDANVVNYYVSLHSYNSTPAIDASLGNFVMESAEGGDVEEMSKSTWESDSGLTAEGDGRFYRVAGVQAVRVRVYRTGNVPYSSFEWKSYAIAGGPSSNLTALNEEAEIVQTIDKNCYLRVIFAAKASRTVVARHEDEQVGTIARGTLEIVDARDVVREVNGYSVSGQYDDGATATVVARPANGYKFKGWYEVGGESPLSTRTQYSFTVNSVNVTLVAKFEEDSVGILLWEGSDENMEMEWTSKVYVAPKPFDPVAARIDATGYPDSPVQLDVGTMSSPNAKPTRPHPIEVASQDGRRLPRMRPERFVRFTVKASCEIDAVVIGTNMAEVN